MNDSKEDLLELNEFTSPIKKPPRLKLRGKNNQIHSPLHASPSSDSVRSDRELASVFSVKKTPVKSGWEDDSEAISEDLISDNSRRNASGGKSGTFIKTTEKIAKLKKSLDLIRRESVLVDEKVRSARSKFSRASEETFEFSFVNLQNDENSEKDPELDPIEIRTSLPQNLQLELKLQENDILTYQNYNNSQLDPLPSPVRLCSIKPTFHSHPHYSKYVQPHPPHSLTEILIINNNILELSLLQVNFLHHPLFSLEHVLVRKLEEIFEEYTENDNKRVLEDLRELRSGEDTDRSDKSEQVTWKEVRKRRERLFREAREQRERMRNILNVWKAIKKLRSHQGFSNTNARLVIKKENVDFATEQAQYEGVFKEIVVQEQKLTYKKKLREYKKAQKDLSEVSEDLDKPTLGIDKAKIEADLKKKFDKSFKPPGEPVLHFQLNRDNSINLDIDNLREEERRSVVASTKFTAKIVCHDLAVCKSKPALLDDNFNLNLNEAISIQLVNVPECLFVELYEHPKGLLKKKIADLKLEIPDPEIDYKKSEILERTFQKQDIVHYKHSGVGSAESLKKILEKSDFDVDLNVDMFEELNTKVVLTYKIGWRNPSISGQNNGSPDLDNVRRFLDKFGGLHENVVRRVVKDKSSGSLDFDCLNLDLCTEWLQSTKDYFRTTRKDLIFCKLEDLDQNLRFLYLKLRDQSEIEFDGLLIPNRIKQIDFGLIKDFKLRKSREAKFKDLHPAEDVDPETLRENGKRRLKQIQTGIFQTCKGMSDNLSYESVVDEKSLIYFEDLIKISLKNFLNWFRWQPKLTNPLPRINRQSRDQAFRESPNKITLKILAGKNVPQRKAGLDVVQPFLHIFSDHSVYKTEVAFGRDPVWNEVVELPLA